MKKFNSLILLSLLMTSLTGCNSSSNVPPLVPINDKDISIVYTTDVHCGFDDSKYLGYSAVYQYKENLKENNYVSLVDSGDFLQGDFIGAISKGEYIIEVMNRVNYDVITLGNHEFDYGMDILKERLTEFNGEVTSCNFSYIGHKEDKFTMVKPYVIKEYGNISVGYIGVTTPTTLTVSDPTNFIEDGEVAYSFGADTKEEFYSLIQNNIDSCKNDGADYIILLSHLGSTNNYAPFRSLDVISNTTGVTAFLDGHAHIDMPWKTVKNKNDIDTLVVDTGYKMNDFASLTISKYGTLSYEFINSDPSTIERSSEVSAYIKTITDKATEEGNKVVANIDIDLSITDENGKRMIRNREMPIGNLVSDAYRNIASSDIGIVNGGGIRANLSKGDVTYMNIMNVHPYGNELVKKKTTGSKILDYLEFTSMKTEHERIRDDKPVGESGAFAHVSGLRYTIDTSIPTSVVTTSSGDFIKVDGPRRVKNVQVLENDTYVDIDPNKEYIIASHNFLLDKGGDGANMFIDDETIPYKKILDFEVLIEYVVNVLNGHLVDKYSSTQGRINVL